MTIDTTELSLLVFDLIERLSNDHAETKDVKLGIVAVIVEVEGNFDGNAKTWIEYHCSDPRRWVQQGLFNAANRTASF